MGVDGLYKFINKNFPDVFNNVSISEIKGKSCIIDGMQHIYGQLIYMRSRDKEVYTKEGKNISHIHGLINSLTYYLKNGIVPIFIFDGKTPDIKKKKIEERKKNLKDNLSKLKDLEEKKKNLNDYINNLTNESTNIIPTKNNNLSNNDNFLVDDIFKEEENMIFGTPPSDTINIEEELAKMNNIQEEYKRIYKKSIVMKDYFIKDWIEILEFLGLPVIKASGEADPLCAYMLKNNPHIYGIISDDSDMLVFGAPVLMRKSINQQFTIIELKKILDKMELLLLSIYEKHIKFDIENLIDYSILLGTDYGNFKLNENQIDSLELLKYYVSNDKNYKLLISPDEYDNFEKIKKYYLEQNYNEEYSDYLVQPKWKKPKLMELKKRLLELEVDEDYIDKNNEFLDLCYNRIKKGKIVFKSNNYDGYNNKYKINGRLRSNSLDSKKSYYYNKPQNYFDVEFKKIKKNPTFYSEKISYENKNINDNDYENNFNDASSNSSGDNISDRDSFDNLKNDKDIESLSSVKNDDGIFYFET
jgi:5'-3' exonuclease